MRLLRSQRLNRYKEVEYEAAEYDPPKVILKRLAELEEEIAKGRAELEAVWCTALPPCSGRQSSIRWSC